MEFTAASMELVDRQALTVEVDRNRVLLFTSKPGATAAQNQFCLVELSARQTDHLLAVLSVARQCIKP